MNLTKAYCLFLIQFIWVIFLIPSAYSQSQTLPLSGRWIGTAELKPYPELVSVEIDSNVISQLYYSEVQPHIPSQIKINSQELEFVIDQPQLYAEFSGKVIADTLIEGHLKVGENQHPCNLRKISPIALSELGNLIGYFQFEDGRVIQIEPFFLDATINPLLMLDFSTGKKRALFPVYKDDRLLKFSGGPKLLTPYPEELSISLHLNEKGEALSLSYTDKVSNSALTQGKIMQNPTNQKEISIENGDVTIQGTITYPNIEEGKHPIIIYVPGAGEQFRGNMFDEYIRLLPYYGISTLVYDKRGCGASTGDYKKSSFEEQATDVLAIIEAIKKDPNVDVKHIGLVGFDQAGYVMPIVGSKTKDISFMVNLSGAVVSLEKLEYTALTNRLTADGFLKEDVDKALSYHKNMFKYLKNEIDSTTFQQYSDEIIVTPWSSYVTSFDNKEYMQWWRSYYDFDPKQYWKKINIPTLTLYGENDLLVEPSENIPLLEKYIKRSRKKGSQIKLLKGANHLLILGEKRGDFQFSEIEGYAPELFTIINEWIGEQTGLK